jgi:serine phosphatase RsbU (regulator of sigma subunit)
MSERLVVKQFGKLFYSVGTQVFAGYVVLLIILTGITVIAFLRLRQIQNNFDHFTTEVTENLILAADTEAQILKVRFQANVYIHRQRDRDLSLYNSHYLTLHQFLKQADSQLKIAEQRQLLAHASQDAADFNLAFQNIILTIQERDRIKADIFTPQEAALSVELAALKAFAEEQGDDALLLAVNRLEFAIRDMRLNVERYLLDSSPTVRAAAWNAHDEALEILGQLAATVPAGRQESLAAMEQALALYGQGFSDVVALSQEAISLQARMDRLEPLFSGDIEDLVLNIRQELADENRVTGDLLRQSRLFIAVTALATAAAGFFATNQFARRLNLAVQEEIARSRLEVEQEKRRLTDELNRKLAGENVRMRAELDVTRRLQMMLLPPAEELAAVSGLDVAGYMAPAEEVGGDYYDVLSRNGTLKIGIGDVTGHGLESGVLMLMTQAAVRTLLNADLHEPAQFMEVVNRTIYDNAQRMQSPRTLTLSLLDYIPPGNGETAGTLTVSGYHEEVIVIRQDGRIERIDTTGLGVPVGLVDDVAGLVQEQQIRLEPGDGIALYTDVITEAENEAGEFYGLDRLCQALSRQWPQPAAAVIPAVINDLQGYMGTHEPFDDITLLVLKQR